MKLYLIKQNLVVGWDTYDSAVVVAKSAKDARKIHPSKSVTHISNNMWMKTVIDKGKKYEIEYENINWVNYKDIDKIEVKYLGITKIKRGVILASFNNG